MKAAISHLCCSGQTRVLFHVYQEGRKMPLCLGHPSLQHPGIFWKHPREGCLSVVTVELSDLLYNSKSLSTFEIKQTIKNLETWLKKKTNRSSGTARSVSC